MAGTDDAASRVIAGRYRLLRRLGAGGMGRVWLAYDQQLACDVALKEIAIPPETPEQELDTRIARALGEARHTARLRGNAHVVTVYDIVEYEGLPWIVMAYVPGARDLGDVVREHGPLRPVETARIGLAVLDALNEGHRLGILHRDVKPSNILLTGPVTHGSYREGLGRVMLTDYGISLQQDSGEPRLTTPSGFIGTPRYLAPERARGSPPTAASDLFSLGTTLYFAVEGHGPFDRDSDVSTLTALLFEEPALPRRAGDLVPVLLGLLVKEPDQRLHGDAATHQLAQLITAPSPEAVPSTHEATVRVVPPAAQPTTQTRPHPPAQERRPPAVPEKSWIHRLKRPLRSGRGGPGAPGRRPSRKARWVIASAGTAVLLAGGVVWLTLTPHEPSGGKETGGGSSPPLFDKLPKKYQDTGVIKVGTDAAYAPMEFEEGGKIVGIDPDIAAALGKELGVKFQFTNGTFDGLISSLNTGRQDIVMSAMSDTKARQQGLDDNGNKTGEGVDFVDYFNAGVSLLVKQGNPENIQSLDDLCGKKVAVQRGTTYEDTFKTQAAKCKADGKGALTIEAFDTDAEAQTRVKSGGAVADLNDYPVAAHIARTAGGGNDFEVAGGLTEAGPFGIAVDKDNVQLRDALKEALDAIIKNGEYAKVLTNWDVEDSAVTEATINAGQ
jgi:polar amino acid transport system substrate-binding protein